MIESNRSPHDDDCTDLDHHHMQQSPSRQRLKQNKYLINIPGSWHILAMVSFQLHFSSFCNKFQSIQSISKEFMVHTVHTVHTVSIPPNCLTEFNCLLRRSVKNVKNMNSWDLPICRTGSCATCLPWQNAVSIVCNAPARK